MEPHTSTSDSFQASTNKIRMMFHKIPTENETNIEPPKERDVFDFYDEELEKTMAEMAEKKRLEKELKARTCRQCNQLFTDSLEVLRHNHVAHQRTKPPLISKRELEHFLNGNQHPTECPICLKKITQKRSVYVQHMMTHCADHSFTCPVCNKKFRRKDHMQNHHKRHIV